MPGQNLVNGASERLRLKIKTLQDQSSSSFQEVLEELESIKKNQEPRTDEAQAIPPHFISSFDDKIIADLTTVYKARPVTKSEILPATLSTGGSVKFSNGPMATVDESGSPLLRSSSTKDRSTSLTTAMLRDAVTPIMAPRDQDPTESDSSAVNNSFVMIGDLMQSRHAANVRVKPGGSNAPLGRQQPQRNSRVRSQAVLPIWSEDLEAAFIPSYLVSKENGIDPPSGASQVHSVQKQSGQLAGSASKGSGLGSSIQYNAQVSTTKTAPTTPPPRPAKEKELLAQASAKTPPVISFGGPSGSSIVGTDNSGAAMSTMPTTASPRVSDAKTERAELGDDKPPTTAEQPGGKVLETVQVHWKPLGVRQMPPLLQEVDIPLAATMTSFTWEFLHGFLGGMMWSPDFYYVPNDKETVLPNRTYYMCDARFEPYLPEAPGLHGAKLTPFFNENIGSVLDTDDAYIDVPLFVRSSNFIDQDKASIKNTYVYFGTYSQLRWSDKLDYDHMVEAVPHELKAYWAEKLTEVGRPEWMTQALMQHFWSKPEYDGKLVCAGLSGESSPAVDKRALNAFAEFLKEMVEWDKEARNKVALLKKENILEAFEQSDAAEEPGLRMWWEYLQCVKWDAEFYERLCEESAKGAYKDSIYWMPEGRRPRAWR